MRFFRTTLLLLGFAAQAHAAPRYTLEALPPTAGPVHHVAEINNAGQVAGTYLLGASPDEQPRGFLYTPGRGYPRLEPYGWQPSDTGMGVADLNEHGEVVGTILNSAYLYRPDGTGGSPSQLQYWPPDWFIAINDSGQALGNSVSDSPFLYTPFRGVKFLRRLTSASIHAVHDLNNSGQVLFDAIDVSGVTSLSLLDTHSGALTSVAALPAGPTQVINARVNDSGLVAATVGPDWEHPQVMLYRAGNSYELWRLTGQQFSQLHDLNAEGRVLGTAIASTRQGIVRSAFLFIPGMGITWPLANVEPATRAGWSNIHLLAINDRGQIAGFGTYEGQQRAFVLHEVAP